MQPSPGRRGDPVWLPEVLRHFGVKVVEDPGWKLWGMGDFGAIFGVVAHHTGANNTSTDFIRYNPMLGDALSSQIHLSRSGVATLVGAGIAWHAGEGSYPGIARDGANQVTIGIEAQSDGTSPWPDAELDAYHRICAAICWYLGLPAGRVISHYEWAGPAQGKWDPGAGNGRSGVPMDMGPFRDRVQQLIDAGPHTPQEGPLMALSDTEQRELFDMTRDIHRELTQRYPSRSAYRTSDDPVDTLAGYVLNAEARIHEDWVHARAAEDGVDPTEWADTNLGVDQ